MVGQVFFTQRQRLDRGDFHAGLQFDNAIDQCKSHAFTSTHTHVWQVANRTVCPRHIWEDNLLAQLGPGGRIRTIQYILPNFAPQLRKGGQGSIGASTNF
jgi:hypothetical protein